MLSDPEDGRSGLLTYHRAMLTEITEVVDLCLPDGRLNPAAVGWTRRPCQPEASSAATSEIGSKNTNAGSTYRNTDASP
jgi:hypothetical protein